MRTTLLVAVLALGAGAARAAEPTVQRFEGEYRWNQGGDDRLGGEFKPTGDGAWDVTFRFDFDGESHTWRGKAQGSLAEGGGLVGTVESTNGRRRWKFEAAVKDGVLSGTHAETTHGSPIETGSFMLAR